MTTTNDGAAQACGATEENTARQDSPPSMGSARSCGGIGEKSFYSPAEVDRLTQGQLDNPKILETIINSMKKWR